MKTIFTAFLTIICLTVFSQTAPAIQWQKSLGGSGSDYAQSIRETLDGGYIVAGYSISTNGDVSGNHGLYDYWIVKLKNNGAIQWQKSLGGSGYDYAFSIQQIADGGYIVAGYADSKNGDVTGNHGVSDYWIVKLKNNGDIQWQKSLGGSSDDRGRFVQQTANGGYIVAGDSYSNDGNVTGNHGQLDYWIVKLEKTGIIQWQKNLGGSGYDFAQSIQPTLDGGYIIAGYSNSNNGDVSGNHGDYDYWIVKLGNSGVIQWQKSLGGFQDDYANSVRQTADGGYIVAGYTKSNNGDVTGNHGGSDYWIVKLKKNGIIQWQKTLGGSNDDYAYDAYQTADRGYIIAGTSSSNDGDVSGNHGNDSWIVKLDKSGVIKWQKTLGGSGYELAQSVQQTTDGGYIIAGESNSTDGDVSGNHGGSDYWVVKLKAGTSVISASEQKNLFTNTQQNINTQQINSISKQFMAYPNPATNSLNIFFASTKGNRYTIEVADLSGKVLQSLQGISTGEQNNRTVDISKYETGLYLLTLKDEKEKRTIKIAKQ